jgi:hypothetical protein
VPPIFAMIDYFFLSNCPSDTTYRLNACLIDDILSILTVPPLRAGVSTRCAYFLLDMEGPSSTPSTDSVGFVMTFTKAGCSLSLKKKERDIWILIYFLYIVTR